MPDPTNTVKEPLCLCGHPAVYHEPNGRCNAVMISANDEGLTCTCECYAPSIPSTKLEAGDIADWLCDAGLVAYRASAPLPSGEPTSEDWVGRMAEAAECVREAYSRAVEKHGGHNAVLKDLRWCVGHLAVTRELALTAHPLPSDAPIAPDVPWREALRTWRSFWHTPYSDALTLTGAQADALCDALAIPFDADEDAHPASPPPDAPIREVWFCEQCGDQLSPSSCEKHAGSRRVSMPPQDAPRLAEVATDKQFSGTWNNWIAPFHHCAFCGGSLNWQQSVDVFDRPLISASCACGVMYSARLSEEGLEQGRAVDAGNKLAAEISDALTRTAEMNAAIDDFDREARLLYYRDGDIYNEKAKEAARSRLLALSGVPAKEAGELNDPAIDRAVDAWFMGEGTSTPEFRSRMRAAIAALQPPPPHRRTDA